MSEKNRRYGRTGDNEPSNNTARRIIADLSVAHELVQHEVFKVLQNVFDKMYPLILVLAAAVLIASLTQTLAQMGSYLFFAAQVFIFLLFLAIALLRRRLASPLVFSLILAIIYVIAVASFFNRGLAGSGIVHLSFFIILAGVYFGLRSGITMLAFGLITIVLVGIGVCTGMIVTKPDASAYLVHPVNWLLHVACMFLYAIPLILSMKGIQHKMMESRQELMKNNRHLEAEIAGRMEMEEKLRASEENYRGIFEHAVEGIFQVGIGGNMIKANPALAMMMGYESPEEMLDQINYNEMRLYVHQRDQDRIRHLIQTTGLVIGYEALLYRNDQSLLWGSINARVVRGQNGEIIHYEGSVEDITQHKDAEQALIKSEANYRNVVESSVAGFFIIQDDLFRFVNRRACELTGYGADEIVDVMTALEPIHSDDRQDFKACMAQYRAGNRDAVPFEARILCQDGKFITARFFISEIQYNDAPAISGTFIDVSREKILESQLRQAHKMEAVGQLAGGIAHDFNNILTAFNGYGTILQIKMSKEDPLRIYVDHILSAAQKATSLTQNLLTFSRQQPISLVPVDINRNIRDTEKLLKRLLTEDIAFTFHLSQENVTILADASQIDRILFNLVANARDAMTQGGHLRLETGSEVFDHSFRTMHGFGKPGRYVRISLSDTGVGMDRQTMEQIFNPFFTTKEPGQGTGLGLATVYGIVKQHDGYVLVDSKPGRGTVFHLYFPAIDESAVVAEEKSLPMAMQGGQETILVADDNDEVRSFIKDVFDLSGYRTIEAVDGEDALRKFHESAFIDMVILDSVMPKMNGRKVFDEIVKTKPDVKALFISGYTRDIIYEKGIWDKGYPFLTKPLSPTLLLEKVREVLDK